MVWLLFLSVLVIFGAAAFDKTHIDGIIGYNNMEVEMSKVLNGSDWNNAISNVDIIINEATKLKNKIASKDLFLAEQNLSAVNVCLKDLKNILLGNEQWKQICGDHRPMKDWGY